MAVGQEQQHREATAEKRKTDKSTSFGSPKVCGKGGTMGLGTKPNRPGERRIVFGVRNRTNGWVGKNTGGKKKGNDPNIRQKKR